MSYKVLFVGLACFHTVSSNDVMALMPDGTDVVGAIHFASIVVRTTDIISMDWPDSHRIGKGGTVFPIETSMTLSFPSSDTSVDRQHHRVPLLPLVDDRFDINRATARTIARLQVHGTLSSWTIPDGELTRTAIYTELVTEWEGDIIMTAPGRSLRLAPGSEIGIRNLSPDNIDPLTEREHFRIYERLSKVPVDLSAGPPAVPGIPPSNSSHPVFDGIVEKITLFCSNTGCC